MAAAEARAVWQRTVNRCFVQEDAKRAPKLTYCQSSSSIASTKQAPEVEDSGSSQALNHPQNQSSSVGFIMPLHRNPNDHIRLWDHHHHHYIQPNQNEQVKKPLETEVTISEKKVESFQEFIELMETKETYGYDESCEKKLNELAFDSSSPWNPLSSEKSEPWWRITDKDELASLVAQRSLEYVENCDLPTPQKMKRSYYTTPRDGSRTIHEHGPSRSKDRTEASCETDLSKTELLEALRHSQTRAREAENMATEANAEKEHLVKLLFKQAYELFGYKQWLQLLQLQALYLQIKNKKIEENNKDPPVSIPWSNEEARRKRRRSKRAKPSVANYAVGLALGMSLVGAGLLLGWTVGWMQILSF